LRQGHLVVCYPGGAWETLKKPRHHYTLRWEGTLGFAWLAAQARVPIVPFAGFGVDDTFLCPDDERLCVPLASGEKYRVPLGIGLGPIPLPVKMTFILGQPLRPPPPDAPEPRLQHFRDHVARTVRRLLLRARHA
jgi:hypothetical protein